MENREVGKEICQFCGKPFSTLAKLDEHLIAAHSSMKLQTEGVRPGIEPADNKQTTELPPGTSRVNPAGSAL
jgi:hypothetical protein